MENTLNNWYPYKLKWDQNDFYCHWINLREVRFTHSFFEESLSRGLSTDVNSRLFKSYSSLHLLPAWATHYNYVAPTAFIFHISRCGSTLLSQLLGIDERVISLSEVPFIDSILRLKFQYPGFNSKEETDLIEAAIRTYGQKRSEAEEYLFIKTDSWHIFFWKIFRKLYPDIPFILIYRRPDEVIRSHQKLRGMQAVPHVIESDVFKFSTEEIAGLGLDEYTILVLEKYFSTYLEIVQEDDNVTLLNYNQGPLTLLEKTAAASKVSFDPMTILAMRKRASFHSKYPEQVFTEPTLEEKVPDQMKKVFALYEQTEVMRLRQLNSS